MKYLRIALIMILFAATSLAYAQQNEEDNIKKTINQLFDGMRKSDSTLIKNAFNDNAILQTISKNKEGKNMIISSDLKLFISSISRPHPSIIYDERIVFNTILIDGDLASVWTDYRFYVGEKFSHCGVNSFQLVKTEKGWKIVYLIDTRRKENCNF